MLSGTRVSQVARTVTYRFWLLRVRLGRTSGIASTAKRSTAIRCYSSYSTKLSKIEGPEVHCVIIIIIIIIEFEDDYCSLYLQLEDCFD